MVDPKINKIYILPNLFTTFNLLCGFYAIIAVMEGNFLYAAYAILIAGVFDVMDGGIARMTGTTSEFGIQYDSLSDLVSFGVAPAFLAYQWALHPFGRYGWLAAFLYTATTALRLARFNSIDSRTSSKNFMGLPCPGAAYLIATTFLFNEFFDFSEMDLEILILLLVYTLSYLMVSTHTYLSLKKPQTFKSRTFHGLVAMVLLIILLATEPKVTFFGFTLVYVLSGPFGDLYSMVTKKRVFSGKRYQDS